MSTRAPGRPRAYAGVGVHGIAGSESVATRTPGLADAAAAPARGAREVKSSRALTGLVGLDPVGRASSDGPGAVAAGTGSSGLMGDSRPSASGADDTVRWMGYLRMKARLTMVGGVATRDEGAGAFDSKACGARHGVA